MDVGLGAELVLAEGFLFFKRGGLAGGVFFPIDLGVFEIVEGAFGDGRGLAFEGVLGVFAPVIRGGDDDAVGERLFPGGGEEAVDVGFFDPVVLGVAFALDGVEFIGAGDFGDEVDTGVLGNFSVILRPIGEQPDIGVEAGVFRLVAEVGADEFLEVGALLALGLGGAAVVFENGLYGRHSVTANLTCGLEYDNSKEIAGGFSPSTDRTLIDRLEEIVALVIHKDEGGEILHGDFPNRFHAEFGKRQDLL